MSAVLARLALAAATVARVDAHATFWWTRGGVCRPPAAGDRMMGNSATAGSVTNQLALLGTEGVYSPGSQHTLRISTAMSEHLLFASSGSLSEPSVGGTSPPSDLACQGLTIAWGGAEGGVIARERTVTWTAPAAGSGVVNFTLAMAGQYGPVTVYTYGVGEGPETNFTMVTEAPTTTTAETTPETTTAAAPGPGVSTTSDTSASRDFVGFPWIAGLLALGGLMAAGFAGQ